MQLVASVVAMLLLGWSVRAFVWPDEDKFSVQSRRELFKGRKDLVKKMLTNLLDEVDMHHDAPDLDDPLESEMEEQQPQTTQRDRKAPCKNFFWKTFTAC